MFGIYIHIPYCRVVCPYCDFVKTRTSGAAPGEFVDALLLEIEAYDGPIDATSLFFGGGTPSLLTPEDMRRIVDRIREHFNLDNPEISIEVNPDDVTPETLDCWLGVGINRVSLGVQSFNDEVLQFLGRCHDASTAHAACEAMSERFENWGLDLIFGCKPSEPWERCVQTALGYDPPHLSAYALTYEERTPFWNQRKSAIDDDIALAQYRHVHDALADYNHYEVSNFAKSGYESRHNLVYWHNAQYASFGPGAVSYIGHHRTTNTRHIDRYIASPLEGRESESITLNEEKLETLIQHFRMARGMGEQEYTDRFGSDLEPDFADALGALQSRGLIERNRNRWQPTLKGFELNNEIGLALID